MSKIGYIYSITSKSTGMVYIGSVYNRTAKYRWNEHKRKLRNKIHENWKLSYLIYHKGMDDLLFRVELKGYFPTYQDLLDIEGIWVKTVCEEFCLNIDRYPEIGGCFYGRKHKQESKDKTSRSLKGKMGESKNPMYGIHPSEETIKKKRQSALNYYKDNVVSMETRLKISESKKGEKNYQYGKGGKLNPFYDKHHTEESIEKIRKKLLGRDGTKKGKEIFLHSPNKERHYFVTNNTRFCGEFKLNHSQISSLVTGKRKHHKGWTGGHAPQWLVDKILLLMGEGVYWVEIDLEGNIING